jgi:hypothetical protein
VRPVSSMVPGPVGAAAPVERRDVRKSFQQIAPAAPTGGLVPCLLVSEEMSTGPLIARIMQPHRSRRRFLTPMWQTFARIVRATAVRTNCRRDSRVHRISGVSVHAVSTFERGERRRPPRRDGGCVVGGSRSEWRGTRCWQARVQGARTRSHVGESLGAQVTLTRPM